MTLGVAPPSGSDNDEEPDSLGSLDIETALQYLRAYQSAYGIPLLPEEEERILLEWIVKGGKIPEHLELDVLWRGKTMVSSPAANDALKNYNLAQIYLLLALARAKGYIPQFQRVDDIREEWVEVAVSKIRCDEVDRIGEAFAMAALDKIRLDPAHPDQVVVEIVNKVLLRIDMDPKTQK